MGRNRQAVRLARALDVPYTDALKQIKATQTRREWHHQHRWGDYPPVPDHPLTRFSPSPPTPKWVNDVWGFSVTLGVFLQRCELELWELGDGIVTDEVFIQGLAMGWAPDLNRRWAAVLHAYHMEHGMPPWDEFSVVGFVGPLLPLIGITGDALPGLMDDLDGQSYFE
ncbi:hypothetical protein BH23ACT9_BH23ACT9_32870 [soil metagenome]